MQSRAVQPYDLTTAEHDLPPWIGAPRRSILICTHPRSGSTLLGEALHFAGGMGSPLEYFHCGFRPPLMERWGVSSIPDLVSAVWRHRTDPSGTLSVKLFWRDVQDIARAFDPEGLDEIETQPPEKVSPASYRRLADLFAEIFPAPEYVHLERRDALRQAVSSALAVETGQWRSIPGFGDAASGAAPEITAERIQWIIDYGRFCHANWAGLFAEVPAWRLTYEDLVGDYAGSVGRLLAHLGSDASPPPVRMQRQADAGSEALVLRYLRARAERPAA